LHALFIFPPLFLESYLIKAFLNLQINDLRNVFLPLLQSSLQLKKLFSRKMGIYTYKK